MSAGLETTAIQGVESTATASLTVVQIGLGKAGMNLHNGAWQAVAGVEGLDISRIGYDASPERRLAAQQAGGIAVLEAVDELPLALQSLGDTPYIVDVTTASGHHAEAVAAVHEAITNSDVPRPAAWVLEKPVVSGSEEREIMEQHLDAIGRERVFVNENYLASLGLAWARERIDQELSSGNRITGIDVIIAKDRVPDVVLRNRFQDRDGLAVYGIEMPHIVAIANALLREELDTRSKAEGGDVVQNDYYHDVDGIEQSEGNYTRLEHGGTDITLRQPLGPFAIGEDGHLERHEWGKEVVRVATVTFADGTLVRVTFDPVAGAPRYHSMVEYVSPDGKVEEQEILEDNTLRNLLGAVAVFATSGGETKHPILDVVGPDDAIRFAEQLGELRANAGDAQRVTSLVTEQDPESPAAFSRRVLASAT